MIRHHNYKPIQNKWRYWWKVLWCKHRRTISFHISSATIYKKEKMEKGSLVEKSKVTDLKDGDALEGCLECGLVWLPSFMAPNDIDN